MLASSGEIAAPCPVPLSLTVTAPFSRMPARSHLLAPHVGTGAAAVNAMPERWSPSRKCAPRHDLRGFGLVAVSKHTL